MTPESATEFDVLLAHIAVELIESLGVPVRSDEIGEVEYDFDRDQLTVRVGDATHSVNVKAFLESQRNAKRNAKLN